jgi:hypothetical protein
MKNIIKIFAEDIATGEREEIEDLYWFEENGVHNFDGRGHNHGYKITMECTVPDGKQYIFHDMIILEQ